MELAEIQGYGGRPSPTRPVLRALLCGATLAGLTVAAAPTPAAAVPATQDTSAVAAPAAQGSSAAAAGTPGSVPPVPGQIVPVPVDVPIQSGSACQIRYSEYTTATNYTATVVIINTGTVVIQGWTLAYPLRAGQTVVATFNASTTLTADRVVARNLPDNGVLTSGQALSVHFWGGRPAGAGAPDWFTVNDTACTIAP